LSAETLDKSLWTDSAANAATAPFLSEPGAPLISTTTHSAATFASVKKFPPLDAWWTDASTWWSMSGTSAFGLALTSAGSIPADFNQLHPALAHLWAANCTALQLKLVTAGATIDHVISPDPGHPALVLPTMLPCPHTMGYQSARSSPPISN
jgi:ABC-type transport system substrate-binding protein